MHLLYFSKTRLCNDIKLNLPSSFAKTNMAPHRKFSSQKYNFVKLHRPRSTWCYYIFSTIETDNNETMTIYISILPENKQNDSIELPLPCKGGTHTTCTSALNFNF